MSSITHKSNIFSVIVTTFVAMSFTVTAEDGTSFRSQSMGAGHGAKQSAGHVVSSRDLARISYPAVEASVDAEVEGKRFDSSLRPRSLLMTEPRRFDRDGIYVWRDPQGVWQIQAVSKTTDTGLIVTGSVETAERIILNATNVQSSSPIPTLETADLKSATLNLSLHSSAKSVSAQFKAEGTFVDFDIKSQGKGDTTQIYLGSRMVNPAFVPFRLENRPVEVPPSSASAQTKDPITINRRKVIVPSDPDGRTQASSRGGSSGGSGNRIKKGLNER